MIKFTVHKQKSLFNTVQSHKVICTAAVQSSFNCSLDWHINGFFVILQNCILILCGLNGL